MHLTYLLNRFRALKHLAHFLLLGLLVSACKKQVEQTQPSLTPISESVYASGIIKSKNQYQVFATVSGLIQKILVQEGDMVKAGDPLFVIQNATAQLNTENARIAADFAEANKRGERLAELKGSIDIARSRMLNDSLLLLRQQGLWAQQIGAKVELEQRELAYTSSRNNYEAAISRYKDLQRQLDFSAKQSKKLLSISNTMNQDYVVRSQTDGRVYSIFKEPGEIVNSQSPLAVIGNADAFMVELQVDEYDISRIKKGHRVLLSLDSYKGQAFEGLVAKINPYMNERSRTFTVDAEFTKKPLVLYPNLTVEANIIIVTKESAMTIPRAYLVDDSTVILSNKEPRKIETGLKDYQKVEVLNGLQAGETILKPAQ